MQVLLNILSRHDNIVQVDSVPTPIRLRRGFLAQVRYGKYRRRSALRSIPSSVVLGRHLEYDDEGREANRQVEQVDKSPPTVGRSATWYSAGGREKRISSDRYLRYPS